MARRAIDWVFKSRTTGKITVAQFPNWSLGVFQAATILRLIVKPTGSAATGFTVVGTGSLLVWALDEVIRGVNPWRRVLGGTTLAWEVAQLLSR